MREVVIVGAGRSPIGERGGSFARAHPADVLGPVQMEVLRRAGVEPGEVGHVIGGCVDEVGAQAMNVTRAAWLGPGGPAAVACSTVDDRCGSSQHALNLARSSIASGQEDVVLACGVEIASLLPIGSDAVAGRRAGTGEPISRTDIEHVGFVDRFEGAERIAERYGVSRDDADELGLVSQERAARAIAEGRFETQLVTVDVDVRDEAGERTGERRTVERDEIPRETSREALAGLRAVARDGTGVHTAGSASQLADGASAVVVVSADEAERRGLEPLARIAATAIVGCDPELQLEGPIPATERMLRDLGIGIDDVDVFEIDEAFAAVVLAWARTVGADPERVNPNGGAIALGHPLGATGTSLTTKAVHELARTRADRALVSMCCGGGIGTGTVLERV